LIIITSIKKKFKKKNKEKEIKEAFSLLDEGHGVINKL